MSAFPTPGPAHRAATPSLLNLGFGRGEWLVTARPWGHVVGRVKKHDAGWTATTKSGQVLGLWPTKQAAAEVLVKQAGYELEVS